MTTPSIVIRLMRPTDIAPVGDEMIACGWGERRQRLQFYLGRSCCRPLVAEVDGVVAATAMTSLNAGIAWLGELLVFRPYRKRGVASALYESRLNYLESVGCRTQLLASLAQSRPLAERFGFRPVTSYRVFVGPPLQVVRKHPQLRRAGPGDEQTIYRLDRLATGEDRSALLQPFITTAWLVERAPGEASGYHVPTPWGQGPVVATDPEAGQLLLDVKRATGELRDDMARVVIPTENTQAASYLTSEGFRPSMEMIRGMRGVPLQWDPTLIWAQFNGSFG